jgi:hypothetical protein
MVLRNSGWLSPDYVALHLRRQESSQIFSLLIEILTGAENFGLMTSVWSMGFWVVISWLTLWRFLNWIFPFHCRMVQQCVIYSNDALQHVLAWTGENHRRLHSGGANFWSETWTQKILNGSNSTALLNPFATNSKSTAHVFVRFSLRWPWSLLSSGTWCLVVWQVSPKRRQTYNFC